MEANIDPENAKRQDSESEKDNARPAEEPGKKCQHSERMAQDETDEGVRLEFHHVLPG
jgi:hypothetical protein